MGRIARRGARYMTEVKQIEGALQQLSNG